MEKAKEGEYGKVFDLGTKMGIKNMTIRAENWYRYTSGTLSAKNRGTIKGVGTAESASEFEKACAGLLPGDKYQLLFKIVDCGVGANFPVLENITSTKTLVKGNLEPKLGEVTLFVIWGVSHPFCEEPMGHNQEILAKHKDWAGKARIVSISVDDVIEPVIQKTSKAGWDLIDSYWTEGGWESEVMKKFSIQGVPFCILVDKEQTIRLMGNPSSVNIEDNIAQLIKDNTLVGSSESEEVKDKSYPFENAVSEIAEFLTTNKENISKMKVFFLEAVRNYESTVACPMKDAKLSIRASMDYEFTEEGLAKVLESTLNGKFSSKAPFTCDLTEIVPNDITIPVSATAPLKIDALKIQDSGKIAAFYEKAVVGEGLLKPNATCTFHISGAEGAIEIEGAFKEKEITGMYTQGANKGPVTIKIELPLWKGFYEQDGECPMEVAFKFDDVACGIGYDSFGASIWIGRKTGKNEFSFTKRYVAQHSIDYKGTLDEENKKFVGVYCGHLKFQFTKSE